MEKLKEPDSDNWHAYPFFHIQNFPPAKNMAQGLISAKMSTEYSFCRADMLLMAIRIRMEI